MQGRPLLIRLQVQVLVAIMTDATDRGHGQSDISKQPSMISVGLLQPLEGLLGFERTGSAATMAVRDAQRRGYLNQTDLKYDTVPSTFVNSIFSYFICSLFRQSYFASEG